MLGIIIFWILFGLTLTAGSVAPNYDLCLGALYNLCPQVSVPSPLYSAVDQWQQPKFPFLNWNEGNMGVEEKTWRLPEITLILKKPKDKKDSWLQEIFSTNTNSTRALLTHDCLKSGNVSHRIDYKLQKHHTKSFKIVVLNSLAQQEPFTKNDFNLGRCLHGFCLWHHSCLKNTLLVKENFLFRSLSAGHQFPPRVSPPVPPPPYQPHQPTSHQATS